VHASDPDPAPQFYFDLSSQLLRGITLEINKIGSLLLVPGGSSHEHSVAVRAGVSVAHIRVNHVILDL
jgi:hypothetical protein